MAGTLPVHYRQIRVLSNEREKIGRKKGRWLNLIDFFEAFFYNIVIKE